MIQVGEPLEILPKGTMVHVIKIMDPRQGPETVEFENEVGEKLGTAWKGTVLRKVVDGSIASKADIGKFIGYRIIAVNDEPIEQSAPVGWGAKARFFFA